MSSLGNSSLLPDSRFPSWVIKKIGEPILTEADWNYGAFPNSKFGLFADGTGAISRDTTNLLVGGAGSLKMLTDNVSNHNTEVKTTTHQFCRPGDLLAFEFKWVPTFAFGSTGLHCGIEPRDNVNIVHARFRYTVSSGEWRYEDASLAYQPFPASIGGALTPEKPGVSTTVGTRWGWARIVVDPINRLYGGFEATGKNFKIETRDMRSLALPMAVEGSSTEFTYLFFNLVQTGAAGAEECEATDWCISRIPAGVNPF